MATVTRMDITALRHAMASGALTAAELTTSCLTRAQELNPVLHAVTRLSDQALAEAAACDQAQATGATPGPLAGIPVLIKDNIEVRGMPATAGSPALAEVDAHDCFLVRRLREAGAVILGKANLSEWANFRAMPSTSGWSTLGGQAANPYALDRNPSGSSSGSAIAVAVGLVPLAVGTETDGSIVSPASACGIVGIKPTVGLLSRAGIVPVSLAQDTAGPMARSVADAAALLSVLAGHDPADPATSPAAGQPRDYTAFLDPGALAGARLGVWRDGARGAGTATRAVLETALAVLREAGAETIDPVALPGAADIEEAELTALLWEFKHDLNAYLAGLRGPHPANLAAIIDFNTHNATTVLATFGQEIFEHAEETSGDLADAGYRAARSAAARLARESLDRPLAEHRLDAIVALTASPAWLTDYVTGDPKTFSSSVPAAVAGYPAVCVPAGQVCGLPVGLSFIGPAWSEPRLIGLAHAFERAATPLPAPSLAPSCQSPMGAGAGASRR